MIKMVEFFIFYKSFFLLQKAQLDERINLFSLVFLAFEFSLAIYSFQLTQYISIIMNE